VIYILIFWGYYRENNIKRSSVVYIVGMKKSVCLRLVRNGTHTVTRQTAYRILRDKPCGKKLFW